MHAKELHTERGEQNAGWRDSDRTIYKDSLIIYLYAESIIRAVHNTEITEAHIYIVLLDT